MGKRVLICILLSTVLLFSACSLSFGAYRNMREQKTPSGWTGTGASYGVSAYTLPEGGTECIIVQDKLFFRIFRPPFNYSVSDGEKTLYETAGMYWGMTGSEDAIIVLENRPKNGTDIFFITVIPIDEQNIRTVQVEKVPAEFGRIKQVFSYGKELLVLYENNKIGILREDGTIGNWLDLPKDYLSIKVCYPYLVGSTAESNDLYIVNCSDCSATLSFSTGKGTVFPDQTEGSLLLATETGLEKIDNSGNKPFVIWDECSLAVSKIHCLSPLGDGNYLLHDEEGFLFLHPIDPIEQKQKTCLNVASLHPNDEIQRFAARFNAENDQYYVKIIDYSDNGNYDKAAAVLRMNTDIISGKYPDMIAVSSVSPFPFIRKGMLINLIDFIKEDDEINAEDISILNALKTDSGVFYLANGFYIETRKGLYSRFGDQIGWSLEEYLDLERTLPPNVMTIYNMTVDGLLDCIIPRYLKSCINWETAICNFTDSDFIPLLKLGKQMRETPEDPNDLILGGGTNSILSGRVITAMTAISNVWTMAEEEYQAGTEISYVGWPTVDGSCGSDVILYAPVGIMNASKNQSGCWQFVKYILTHPVAYLPIYRPALLEAIEEAKNDKDIQKFFTEEDAKRFLNLVSHLDNVKLYDEVLMNIIRTECNGFLYGTRTAEDTAAIIQSKVSIYLAEQQ